MKAIPLSEMKIDEEDVARREADRQALREKRERDERTKYSRLISRDVKRAFQRVSKRDGQKHLPIEQQYVVACYWHPEVPRCYFAMEFDSVKRTFWGHIMDEHGNVHCGTFTVEDLRWFKELTDTHVRRTPGLEREPVQPAVRSLCHVN